MAHKGVRCTLGKVELCSKWNKPGLNPQAGQCFQLYSVLVFITWNKCPLQSNLFEFTRTVTNFSGFVTLLRFSAEMCCFISVCLFLNSCITSSRFPCSIAYKDPGYTFFLLYQNDQLGNHILILVLSATNYFTSDECLTLCDYRALTSPA